MQRNIRDSKQLKIVDFGEWEWEVEEAGQNIDFF
jgi:hypothetical protein